MSNYRSSYWEQTVQLKDPDVCIVGGGLTGLQTALELKQRSPDLDVLLLERSAFGRGASTRNAGFACFGAPTELLEDLEAGDGQQVWETVARRNAGILKLKERYGNQIDYQQHGGYEVFYDKEHFQPITDQLAGLNKALHAITGMKETWSVADQAAGINPANFLLYNPLEGQLNPAKLVDVITRECLAAGVRLLFGLEVASVGEDGGKPYCLLAESETVIRPQRLVLATNAFTGSFLKELPIQPARNQVLITEPIQGLKLRGCFHHERGYVYFRNVGEDRLLIGGARHLAGEVSETTSFGANAPLEIHLTDFLNRAVSLPKGEKIKVAQRWSGIIAQGGKTPLLFSRPEGIIVAARLSGMGVALSAQLATETADLVLS